MATILAHIRVREGLEARFEELAAELHRATHASETAVLRYEYWRGSEPRTYYGLLAFADYAAFLAHQTSPHHEEATPGLGEVIEEIRLEWVDPLRSASPLPATAPRVPPHADPTTQRAARLFAAHVAEWWQPLRDAG